MPTRRWRFYAIIAGRQPVRDFLDGLTDVDRAAVVQELVERRLVDWRERGRSRPHHQ